MKKLAVNSKYSFIIMFALIVICEILLRMDNMIIQSLGIFLVPFIVVFGFLIMMNDHKKIDLNK